MGFGGKEVRKKIAFKGGLPKKIKKKKEGLVKYFTKTLKWYNVLINKVLEFKRKKMSKDIFLFFFEEGWSHLKK